MFGTMSLSASLLVLTSLTELTMLRTVSGCAGGSGHTAGGAQSTIVVRYLATAGTHTSFANIIQ